MQTLNGKIRVDFRSSEPAYAQIARQVEEMVRSGQLAPGDQLPTVREMAIDLRINFSTVARAYKQLDEQRLISTQRGRGTYIEAQPHEPPPNHPPPRELLLALAQKSAAEAQRLGFTAAELVEAIQTLPSQSLPN